MTQTFSFSKKWFPHAITMSTIVGKRKGVKEKNIFLNRYLYCNFYLDTNDEKRKWHRGENDNVGKMTMLL